MSLEQALAANTAAMIALTAALSHRFPEVKEVEAPKPAPIQAAPVTAPTVVVEPVPVAESPSRVDYTQVAKAITDVFKVDRVRVIEALAKFGAAKGPQLKEEDYAAFLKELTA
jgi:hypothetical protein